VIATELYGDATLPRDEVLERFTGASPNVTVYGINDYKSPYASGSAKVDAYVVCPCSMSTVGTLATGRDGESDPPGRVRRAEGGTQARAGAARDAALVHPPAGPRDACSRRAR
jgi:hypothetical protein